MTHIETTSPFKIIRSPLKETTPKKVVTEEPAQEIELAKTAVTQETPEESSCASVEKAALGAGLSTEVSLGPESMPPKTKTMMAFREANFSGDLD